MDVADEFAGTAGIVGVDDDEIVLHLDDDVVAVALGGVAEEKPDARGDFLGGEGIGLGGGGAGQGECGEREGGEPNRPDDCISILQSAIFEAHDLFIGVQRPLKRQKQSVARMGHRAASGFFSRCARLRGGPAFFGDLAAASNGEGVGGDIFCDAGTGADVGAVADGDGRDERGVTADEDALADAGDVLVDAVVVAGDGAGADVGCLRRCRRRRDR